MVLSRWHRFYLQGREGWYQYTPVKPTTAHKKAPVQEKTGTGGWFPFPFTLKDLQCLSCSCLLTPYTWQQICVSVKSLSGVLLPSYKYKKINIWLLKVKSFWPAQKQNWNHSISEMYFTVLFIAPKNSFSEKHLIFQLKLDQKSNPCTCMASVCISQEWGSKPSVTLHRICRTQISCTSATALPTSIFGILGCAEVILVDLLCLGC